MRQKEKAQALTEKTSNEISLVFSQWISTLDILEKLLMQNGIDSLRIDGRTNVQRRNKLLAEFQENPGARVLLMTIGTGAVGYVFSKDVRYSLQEL